MQKINKILVVGATGSIGQYVVTEALNKGYQVRALVRTPNKTRLKGLKWNIYYSLEDF